MKQKTLFLPPRGIPVMLVVFTMLLTANLFAQVTGTVLEEGTDETLIGASVSIIGTTTGTVTDFDGSFSIDAQPGDVLEISYTGYATQSLTVGAETNLLIRLTQGVLFDEVVVTGYQTQRKRDISGAVSVISTDDMETVVASSFAQKLAGRAAGVTVSSSGSPGDATNVRIRGVSSFGNNDPLYIIDGIPVQDKGNLNLNPNDIESMQVLKDASTASIYGSRASNGVIVITTKQGKAGKTSVTYSGSVSAANPVKGWNDLLITDANEYLDMTTQFFNNGGAALPAYIENNQLTKYIYPATNGDPGGYDRYANPVMLTSGGTDWWDAITRTGLVNSHNLTVTGGNESATFAIGAGYLDQQGVLQYNDFKRANIRANSSFKIGKRLRIGENLNIARRQVVNTPVQAEGGVIAQVYKIAPIVPVYDEGTSIGLDGERNSFGGSKSANTGNAANPLAALYRGQDNKNNNLNILGNVYAELEIMDNLTFKTTYSVDLNNSDGKFFTFRTPENQENQGAQNFGENWGKGETWTWSNTLSYNTDVAEKHNVGVLLGYESIKGKFRNLNGGLNDYFTTDINIWYLNPAFGNPDTRFANSNGSENTLLSTFAKVDYAFDDTYLISATIRRDGSSRFSEGLKYGTFPAVSFAWRLSNLPGFSNIPALSDLKLRASWGRTGNQNIANYNDSDRYGGTIGSAFYDINGTNSSPVTGFTQTSIGTLSLGSDTKWEEAETINFGLDAGLFDDAITLVVDVYSRKTKDLLYNASLPGTAGIATAPFRNVSSMKNNGFDIGISYRKRISSDVALTVDFNAGRYKNEITKIDGESTFFYPNAQQGRIGNRLPEQININQIGSPISSFRGYTVDGIFGSQSELDALDQTGKTLGGLRFKDFNGDGQINDDDISIIGSPHPDLTLGLNVGVSYKQFDLTVFVNSSIGNEIFNYTKLFTHFRQFFSNVDREYYLNNGQRGIPALNVNDTGSRSSSTYYVEDGSYVRLGLLQLGYTLPNSFGSSIGLNGLKVYVQGQNLLTITGYSGLDPALSNANIGGGGNLNDLWTGYDLGQYPSNKLITFGVTADF